MFFPFMAGFTGLPVDAGLAYIPDNVLDAWENKIRAIKKRRQTEFEKQLMKAARKRYPTIIFSEGHSPAIAQAAMMVVEYDIGTPVVVGEKQEVHDALEKAQIAEGTFLRKVNVLSYGSPSASVRTELREHLCELRYATPRQLTAVEADELIHDRHVRAMLEIELGHAQVGLAGKEIKTGPALRKMYEVAGKPVTYYKAGGCSIVELYRPTPAGHKVIALTDPAVLTKAIPHDVAMSLVDAAAFYQAITGVKARVAVVHYSTQGSSEGEASLAFLTEVAQASYKRIREIGGEADPFTSQMDVSVDPAARGKILGESEVAGQANVFGGTVATGMNTELKTIEHFADGRPSGPFMPGWWRKDKIFSDASRNDTPGNVFRSVMTMAAFLASGVQLPNWAF